MNIETNIKNTNPKWKERKRTWKNKTKEMEEIRNEAEVRELLSKKDKKEKRMIV